MILSSFVDAITATAGSLIDRLQAGESPEALGLRRAARLPVLAALWSALNRPILLLTDRADRALTLAEELAVWAPDARRLFFPEPTPLFYEHAAWGENTRRDRLLALSTLAAYHIPGAPTAEKAPILIAPGRALMARTMPRREFLKATRVLRVGQENNLEGLVRRWVSLGYEPVNTVIAPGQFARRGGILDLWPPIEPRPLRLEFFGDEIDAIHRFDPATQITVKGADIDHLLITPAREFLAPEDEQSLAGARALARPPQASPTLEAEAYERLSEFYIPLFHATPASLVDYLPRKALVVIDDFQAVQDTVINIEEAAFRSRREWISDGMLPADFPIPFLSWSELRDSLASRQSLQLGQPETLSIESQAQIEAGFASRFEAEPRFGGRLKLLMDYLGERYAAQEAVVLVSRQAARLQELWQDNRLIQAPEASPPQFLDNSLSEGWGFTPAGSPPLHLLTDGEIFGWRRPEVRRRARPVAEAPEAAFSDLQPEDWVVHVDHGIGRFSGLVRRTVDNVEREYLAVEYADEAQLFVPIHQVDRLTRYVGPDSREPSLSRLGGTEWRTVKSHVKEAVKDVAEDLLELYAARSVVQGHVYSPDTAWQQELEASFPYVETEDQVRVLQEVKQDMESPRPTDRLICGDVGYGKTEVALRAAFKAVMEGLQVAVLVPTTVLAQQHYNTFLQRLAAFPVTVEMLSRFRTAQQQREIIKRLADGSVDIIIGTHRLLSADVDFKNLGLLIIDEEQRFGVAHKEKLKKLRTELDVITLTATPIPRTLYMALSGVRDISTINTPPEERLPVITHVGPYSPRLVRQAILRDIERGGQVFFVHNRVQTIGAMRNHLERLVPEARLTVAHGQMPENELSERMKLFEAGDVDVLLSTSIIESGLDIPNANTLIVDRADTFGLAQLYQLRGRVGRGAMRAYAYFFRHRQKPPTGEGRQRLDTIAENTQLGAGFSIAMRDLEIRGAGDILGNRQSGHIAAVGFHLYTHLLADAVRRLRAERGLPPDKNVSALERQLNLVNVELPLPISIPADYVADKETRLGLYRRMANVASHAEIETLAEEFDDRFGPPPEEVLNLLFQLQIKLLAESAGLAQISYEGRQMVFRFPAGNPPENLPDLGPGVRVGRTALWLP
ncbi:MAG TPA: transcription-repair coupling factor, partial [Anaerolineales bacterium]|nr:transcription-repair coupling factor [Anaerolineales bacterium]